MAAKKSTPKITLASVKRASGTGRIINGDPIVATGTATKTLAGVRVYLQRYSQTQKKWVTANASAAVAGNGTYRMKTKSAGSGAVPYRVISKANTKLNASSSNARKITVWVWYNLVDYRIVDEGGSYCCMYLDRTLSIGGRVYTRSILGSRLSSREWVDFNLSYRCSVIRTTVGMNDSSVTGSERLFSVSVDGVEKQSVQLKIGQARTLDADARGGFRVRLESFVPPGVVKDSGAWGSPKVLCTAPPGTPR